MKKMLVRNLLLIVLLLTFASAVFAQQALRLPPYKKVKLSNGLTVMLMEQHEVPLISFSVLVRAGAVNDPPGKDGLSSVTADLLRKGTRTRTADQLSSELDFIGGTLDFGAGHDVVIGSAEVMKKDLKAGLDLLGDVLQNPVFPQAEVTRLLSQRIDAVRQQKDQAQLVIGSYFDAFLFGAHPYARPVTGDERTLAAITRADVVKFYESNYGPQVTSLAVVGDFNAAEMERLLADRFGAWKQRGVPAAVKLDNPVPVTGRRLLLVDKPDSTQTFFLIGNVGVSRTNPDRVGIGVVNTIFGGRFTSMLNDALRVSSGLTYGARSGFEENKAPGKFVISTYTQNKTTVQAIDLALSLLNKLHEQGVTQQQLDSAKAYLKGQFAPQIETSDQLAGLLVELDFFGLDEREINDYFARIDALTLADARRIIHDYFPKENLVFVLIGRADEIRDEVRKYAPQIEVKEISRAGF
ncbi:MAG TPA: pitrilysin family protein [Blastocatellia bacterium]|nr:pitrilysin family protein [Blastocatellia bacterium]